jgi:hypothetical protein
MEEVMAVYQVNEIWQANSLQEGNDAQPVNEIVQPVQTYPVVQPQSPFED